MNAGTGWTPINYHSTRGDGAGLRPRPTSVPRARTSRVRTSRTPAPHNTKENMVTDKADLTEQTRRMMDQPISLAIASLARHILKQHPHLTMEEAEDCARAEHMAALEVMTDG